MDFPITNLMDEGPRYAKLVSWLHPDRFSCPRCREGDRTAVHRRRRPPALDYRCGHCGWVLNAFTRTALQGVKRRPTELFLIVRGFAHGVPTAQLSRELGCDRSELLNLRHRLQDLGFWNRERTLLDDTVLESDEAYQDAGKKASRTATRRSRRGGEGIRPGVTLPGAETARRSAARSGGRAGTYG